MRISLPQLVAIGLSFYVRFDPKWRARTNLSASNQE